VSRTLDRPGRARRAGDRREPAGQVQLGSTVATYSGTSSARRVRFTVGSSGSWGISWRFSCRDRRAGRFRVGETDGRAVNEIELTAYGPNGHGLSWESHDPGDHLILVSSNCAWQVSVVLPNW
jgi:hypothetical protein